MATEVWTRDACAALDEADSLAGVRDRFVLPDGVIYLDGNSLGPMSTHVPARMETLLVDEWGHGLIRSWIDAGWMDAPLRVGAKIAPLVGAQPDEIVVADSTSVNIFKLLSGALRARPDRPTILTARDDFPTDAYVAEGLIEAVARDRELRRVDPARVRDEIGSDTAVVMLTHINYRTGHMHDMAELTRLAHAHGALVLWDLSHSAGAVPLHLDAWDVDLAVGCGYKYLNGGPGAPAFLFVRSDLQDEIASPLTGWMGHTDPFTFADAYVAARGIRRYLCGAPVILGVQALDCALDVWADVSIDEVRAKSTALTDLFIHLVDDGPGSDEALIASPRDAELRGSQVTVQHPHARQIVSALADRLVLTDFRPPDLVRFGFAPLYVRFVDVWDAAQHLAEVLAGEEWRAKRGAPERFVP
jgi:kynureninase